MVRKKVRCFVLITAMRTLVDSSVRTYVSVYIQRFQSFYLLRTKLRDIFSIISDGADGAIVSATLF